MEWNKYRQLLADLNYGKKLPAAIYVHRESAACADGALAELVSSLSRHYSIGPEFNVVKFRTDAPRVSFLSYPCFDSQAHPALSRSLAVDFEARRTCSTSYEDNVNPPILHRKELLLSPTDERIPAFARLSAAEEAAGLFENTSTIGFRLNWERVLAARGLAVEDHCLVQQNDHQADAWSSIAVQRHRTALTRHTLSKPVRTILEHQQLQSGTTFFDYGCGLGSDVRGLQELGIDAAGWDPAYCPDAAIREAEVVNMGYVLNVIEDPAERLEALLDAWKITKRLLVVSALVGEPRQASAVAFGDGVITSRQTFQKYFAQHELQLFVEDAVEKAAIAVSIGIIYIFRSEAQHHAFLQRRSRRTFDWKVLSIAALRKPLPAAVSRQPRARRLDRFEEHLELLEAFWESVLQYGRLPLPAEFPACDDLRTLFGSEKRALGLLLKRGRRQVFETVRAARRNDLLIYLASANLRRRIPFQDLPDSICEDIRSFFGSYRRALEEGLILVHAAADATTLTLACDDTDIGWQDERGLYFSVALLNRLPTVVRAFVGCAELLFGDATQADLIKVHKFSGKATFLSYQNFERSRVPTLITRTKVDLRAGNVEVFDHSTQGQLLYFKERFLAPDDPQRPALLELGEVIRRLGVNDNQFLGPNNVALHAILSEAGRLEVLHGMFAEEKGDA